MPTISPASASDCVTNRSSSLGVTLPLGWLWAQIKAVARSVRAPAKTSRGWTRVSGFFAIYRHFLNPLISGIASRHDQVASRSDTIL